MLEKLAVANKKKSTRKATTEPVAKVGANLGAKMRSRREVPAGASCHLRREGEGTRHWGGGHGV